MRLYITGIKSKEDAQKAVRLGASAIGIKMGYTKEDVHPETAREIFFSLPVFISRVGIFTNEQRFSIQELITFCRLDTLHFTGNEQPADLERYQEHLLKTFEKEELERAEDYPVEAIIVRIKTGIPIEAIPFSKKLLILSGNLSMTEWITAVKEYKPFAIQLDLSDIDHQAGGKLLTL